MGFVPGVPELLIIVLIVVMLFGVGKLPEVFGAVGKGIKEFRKEAGDVASLSKPITTELPAAPAAPAASAATTVAPVSENNVDATVKLPQ